MQRWRWISVILFLVLFASLVSADNIAGTSQRLYATLISQQPDPVSPGNFLEVRFNIENNGGAVSDLTFELVPSYPLSLIDSGSKYVGSILAGQLGKDAVTLYYKLKVDANATAGNATLKLRYKTLNGAYTTFDEFTIRVREPQAFLTISSVVTNPAELVPGKSGEIKVGITNYAKFTMRNVKLTLPTSATSFTGFDSGADRFISSIGPGQTVYETFKVLVSGSATSKVQDTAITMTYEDEIGTSYSKTINVGLIINEHPQYLVNVEESTIFYQGQTGNVVFSIANTGTSEMKFAILELLPADDEEYEIISAPKVYVGNLESDDYETITYKVHVNSVEESVPFKLQLSYKDTINAEYNDNIVLHYKVYSKSKAASYGLAVVPGIGSYMMYLMVFVLVIVFTIFMVLDWMHNPMPRYKHILWLIVILTFGIGALVYYFFGRKKAEI
jgi:hypothetical protein